MENGLLVVAIAAAALFYVSWKPSRTAAPTMPQEAKQQLDRELRRPPRVDVNVHVEIRAFQRTVTGSTEKVAEGGMLLRPQGKLSPGEPVHVAFALPDGPAISISGAVLRRHGENVAIRFDATDKQRRLIAQWVEKQVIG
jgi:hypothetical protein